MKTMYLWLLACLALMMGCQSSDDGKLQPEETFYETRFSLRLDADILPFSTVTKSMPQLTMPEPSAKSEPTSPEQTPDPSGGPLYTQIEYIVYKQGDDGEKLLLKHTNYDKETTVDDFGIIYDRLAAGHYTIVFVTHSSPAPTLENGQLIFKQITDTFWKVCEYEISSTGETNDTPVLSRIISKVEIVTKDEAPSNQAKFTIQIAPYLLKLNVFTGKADPAGESYVIDKELTPEEIGKTGRHQFFTFVAEDDSPIQLTLTSSKADGDILRKRVIKEHKPVANKTIRYTGLFYLPPKGNDSFDITIEQEGKWDETDEIPLPDLSDE